MRNGERKGTKYAKFLTFYDFCAILEKGGMIVFREVREENYLMANQFVTSRHAEGLTIRELSYGIAPPGRITSKLIRGNYHLHVIVDGEACFDETHVKAGDVVLLRPYQPHQLRIVGDCPFKQYWFSFEGSAVPGLLRATALASVDLLHVDISHLYPLLHDGVFGACHENLLALKAEGLLKLTLAALPAAESSVAERTFASVYINRAVDFLRLNHASGITMADVAEEVGITEKYLYKLFRRELGTTPMEYLNQCRIHRAEMLLTTTALSIAEIARQCGFEDAGYFSRFYRRQRGRSPTQYRAEMTRRTASKPDKKQDAVRAKL